MRALDTAEQGLVKLYLQVRQIEAALTGEMHEEVVQGGSYASDGLREKPGGGDGGGGEADDVHTHLRQVQVRLYAARCKQHQTRQLSNL